MKKLLGILLLAGMAVVGVIGFDSPVTAGGNPQECYSEVSYTEFRYAQNPIYYKRGKLVKGAEYVNGTWQDGDANTWYPVPESLQPPHENTIPPTGNVGPGTYGLHKSVQYKYDEFSLTGATQWFPSETGWTRETKSSPWILVAENQGVENGDRIPCDNEPNSYWQKELRHGKWSYGQPDCDATENTKTRTVSKWKRFISFELDNNYQWQPVFGDWQLMFEREETRTYPIEATACPPVTVPETTVPETTVPETTVPETTIPETTVPETTTPSSTTVPPVPPVTPELPSTGGNLSLALVAGILATLGAGLTYSARRNS